MSVLGAAAERNLKRRLKRIENKARRYAREVAAECAAEAWKVAGGDQSPEGRKVFDEHYERVFDELYKAKLDKLMADSGYTEP